MSNNQRDKTTKPFYFDPEQHEIPSRAEDYNKSPAYVEAKDLDFNCQTYAYAYSQTVVRRLAAEQPDFFEENGTTKLDLIMHLVNNMCLPVTKYKNRMFRERTAEIKSEYHLKDEIRRLSNGGDKFHPYI